MGFGLGLGWGYSLGFSFGFSSLGFSPFFPKNSFPKSLLKLMGFWKSFVWGGNTSGVGVVSSWFLNGLGFGA
jgi:hypothetical protein